MDGVEVLFDVKEAIDMVLRQKLGLEEFLSLLKVSEHTHIDW
jgi:hypothetical protein